ELIIRKMDSLSEITMNINNEMSGMASSIQGMSNAMDNVSKSTQTNQQSMLTLSGKIGDFKL
ncbi:MAG: hypothetical protein J6W46_12240, partial [Spirochaetaceae bacterium]|nr:hypothetical protein [Spirochaetaceae bacterium]